MSYGSIFETRDIGNILFIYVINVITLTLARRLKLTRSILTALRGSALTYCFYGDGADGSQHISNFSSKLVAKLIASSLPKTLINMLL